MQTEQTRKGHAKPEQTMKPHIHLSPSRSYARAIVCGSPERAEFISHVLENSKCLARHREYHSYLGTYSGQEIIVVSHGVGSAGAAICFQELIDVGARAIIRIGTAGGLYDGAQIGDVVIATAAIRRDGVTGLMVPPHVPAVPDIALTYALMTAAQKGPLAAKAGMILTSDLFYGGVLDDELELHAKAGAIAVEMECSTLFIIGLLRKIKTAAILVLDGNPLKWAEGQYDPSPARLQASTEACVQAALGALVNAEV